MEEDMKLKNDLNDLLIEEKNKLEEKVVSNLATMQKMFKERNVMKEMIDKQKNYLKNAGNIVPNTSDENDLAKKLAEKTKDLKAKEALLEHANKDKRRLAKDLSEAQNKKEVNLDEDEDKVSKLSNILKNKNAELKKANDEAKKITASNKDIQEKLNAANNTIVTLQSKSGRLEKQVENLIEACGNQPSDNGKKVSFETTNENKTTHEKIQVKCIHNDKGRCRKGSECNFLHSNIVCKSYSKTSFCENEKSCTMRHPIGICLHWKKGYCDKDSQCFYRHPEEEFGSMIQNDGSSSPTLKRKRTFSNQNNQNTTPVTNNSSETHFLYQKVMELTKELEEQKAKIASSQMSTPSQQAGPQLLSRPNMQDQFCRQSTPVQYPGQAYKAERSFDVSPSRSGRRVSHRV